MGRDDDRPAPRAKRAAGLLPLCNRCKARLVDQPRDRTCGRCRAVKRRQRRRRVERGLCRECGRPRVPGRKTCEVHRAASRDRLNERTADRRAGHACTWLGCSRPCGGAAYCVLHKVMNQRRKMGETA